MEGAEDGQVGLQERALEEGEEKSGLCPGPGHAEPGQPGQAVWVFTEGSVGESSQQVVRSYCAMAAGDLLDAQ